jgi:hypothetical protein
MFADLKDPLKMLKLKSTYGALRPKIASAYPYITK